MTPVEVAQQASQMMFVFALGVIVSYLFYQWYARKYGMAALMEFAEHWQRAIIIFVVAMVVIRMVFAVLAGMQP